MKKFFYCLILLITICAVFACTGMAPKEQVIGSDNCYLVDFNSGRVLYAKGENDKKPIASMVKIMTLRFSARQPEQMSAGQGSTAA